MTDNDREQQQPTQPEHRFVHWADMTWRDYLRVGSGVFFFLLGILGLILPVLQGVLFLIISAILLAPYSRWVHKQLDRGERRFPWVAAKARSITRRWRTKTRPDE